jgi:hypothetical protein
MRLAARAQRFSVEGRAHERGQMGQRVEDIGACAPERCLPLVEGHRVAVVGVDRLPALERGRLGVEDRAVEVEDQRAYHGVILVAAVRRSKPARPILPREGGAVAGTLIVGHVQSRGGVAARLRRDKRQHLSRYHLDAYSDDAHRKVLQHAHYHDPVCDSTAL